MDDEATVESSESVGAGPTTDTSATSDGSSDEPVAAPPPGRSRLAVAMLVVSGVLVIGAVVLGVLSLSAQSEASDDRDQAAAAVERRHDLADEERSVEAEHDALVDELLALPDKYFAAGDQFDGLIDAHNAYIDVLDRAIDVHNSGDVDGATAVLSGDGARAITDMNAKKTATQQAVQAAEDALHQVQEGL